MCDCIDAAYASVDQRTAVRTWSPHGDLNERLLNNHETPLSYLDEYADCILQT
jgi:hypothetical protein